MKLKKPTTVKHSVCVCIYIYSLTLDSEIQHVFFPSHYCPEVLHTEVKSNICFHATVQKFCPVLMLSAVFVYSSQRRGSWPVLVTCYRVAASLPESKRCFRVKLMKKKKKERKHVSGGISLFHNTAKDHSRSPSVTATDEFHHFSWFAYCPRQSHIRLRAHQPLLSRPQQHFGRSIVKKQRPSIGPNET